MTSLGWRITIILVLVTALAVTATAASTFWFARRHMRITVSQRLDDEARDAAVALDGAVWRVRRDLETWSSLQPVELLRTGDPDLRLSKLLLALARRSPGVFAIHAVDESGVVRASSDAGAVDRRWQRPGHDGRAGAVAIGAREPGTAALSLWIRVRSTLDGASLGTLVVDLDAGFFDDLLRASERARTDETWFATVVRNHAGEVIGGTRLAGLALGSRVPEPRNAPSTDALATIRIGTETYVAATTPEPGYEDFSGLGWWVTAMQPRRDALALERVLTRAALYVALAMVVLAALLGSVGARTIVRPIRELASLMEQAATGDFRVRARSTRRDEVGALARAFDAMVGDLSRIVAELADARHSQAVAEERERLADLKTRFVAMASHEFRTPLAVILAASDNIRRYGDRMTPAQQHERLNKIGANVRFMTELLEDVMLLGRAESGSKLTPTPFDFGALVRELCEEVRTSSATACVDIAGDADAGEVVLDPKLTRQILRNLISNAVKYSPAGAVVEVRIVATPDRITTSVADHGIGIPVEDQARLFEPFQRAANVGEIHGTGLGLAITRKAVDVMDGSIMVASAVGEGTTFRVTLPRTIAVPVVASPDAADADAQTVEQGGAE